jgi:hypothetical protein
MKQKIMFVLLFLPLTILSAQTTKKEVMANILLTGGNYYCYPAPNDRYTPAPEGYKPFYISHYGRHGARYMTSNDAYDYSIAIMDSAKSCGALTTFGKDVLKRLEIAYQNAYKRDGDLSKLGAQQHQGIAYRMYKNYPELLSKPINIDARASTVRRCILSMSNFCQELRALNPKLKISMDASTRDMWYIANKKDSIAVASTNDDVNAKARRFEKIMIQPDRLLRTLFSNSDFTNKNVDGKKLMHDLYNIEEDMQCLPELKLSFADVFTKEELFNLWECRNIRWYYDTGFAPGTTPYYKARYSLLRNILNTADDVIRSGNSTVTLRFGHDTEVAPLAFLLHLKGCYDVTSNIDSLYTHWANFQVIPMAANIQIIFYRKEGSKDILVKFLQNEHESSIPLKTDCAPYYHWKDVEAYYRTELAN